MKDPKLVSKCLFAMKEKSKKVISVKCRIGVDDIDSESDINNFIDGKRLKKGFGWFILTMSVYIFIKSFTNNPLV